MTLILPHRAFTIRKVQVELGRITAADLPLPEFRAHLLDPEETTRSEQESSPRDLPGYALQFLPDPMTPALYAPQHAGDRVVVGDDTYECLGHARKLKAGRRQVGVEVAVMPIDVLYPLRGMLKTKESDPDGTEISFAMWFPAEQVGEKGTYVAYEAEAPLEFKDELSGNKFLEANGERYHIARSYFTLQGPRVRMTLRVKSV